MPAKGTRAGKRTCKVCSNKFPTEGNINICPNCRSEIKLCECGCGQVIAKYCKFSGRELHCTIGHRIMGISGPNNPNWRGGPVTVECEQCGAPLEASRGQYNQRKKRDRCHFFCSDLCQYQWRSERFSGAKSPRWRGGPQTVRCAFCGQPKTLQFPAEADYYDLHFCNQRCQGAWKSQNMSGPNNSQWKGGGISYYGPNWSKQRRKARKRDRVCQRCGRTPEENGKALDVHHIVPFRTFGYILDENDNYLQANVLSNLQCLCLQCHPIVEAEANNHGTSK